jgi:hypothetical protein
MLWLVLLPARLMAAMAVYSLGIVLCLTIVGLPAGLACFSLARSLAAAR